MHILVLFLDGIGLGENDLDKNPFAIADMPTIHHLTNGKRWLADTGRQTSDRAVFVPTDPRLGIAGRPQSGTGQATILTGLNVPQMTGRHYGPKPDADTREIIKKHSYFKRILERGKKAHLLTAYPQGLIADFERGKTLRSSIQQAAFESGQPHFTVDDVINKRALTAEWTTSAWQRYLKIDDVPDYSAREAGQLLAQLSRNYDFAFHSHWFTDRVGHRGPFTQGVELLEKFDQVLTGILDEWDDDEGLIVVISDHGNMEDISVRHHTENDIRTLIIGKRSAEFADGYSALTDLVPACDKMLFAP
jgi:2,3-bisphosphoglycerate-independent phosphoglycerate mutase